MGIKARQEVMKNIATDAKKQLAKESSSKDFITKLIVQGLLMLLDKQVLVRCRQSDVQVVNGCLKAAQERYTSIIKKETGQTIECALKVDDKYLASDCMGGI